MVTSPAPQQRMHRSGARVTAQTMGYFSLTMADKRLVTDWDRCSLAEGLQENTCDKRSIETGRSLSDHADYASKMMRNL